MGDEDCPYVYVNEDGSVRELTAEERHHISIDGSGIGGAAPYIKRAYESVDGWGLMAGHLRRSAVPDALPVKPASTAQKEKGFRDCRKLGCTAEQKEFPFCAEHFQEWRAWRRTR